jgi:hypothetical protein
MFSEAIPEEDLEDDDRRNCLTIADSLRIEGAILGVLLEANKSLDVISKATGMSLEEIVRLKTKILLSEKQDR